MLFAIFVSYWWLKSYLNCSCLYKVDNLSNNDDVWFVSREIIDFHIACLLSHVGMWNFSWDIKFMLKPYCLSDCIPLDIYNDNVLIYVASILSTCMPCKHIMPYYEIQLQWLIYFSSSCYYSVIWKHFKSMEPSWWPDGVGVIPCWLKSFEINFISSCKFNILISKTPREIVFMFSVN